MKNNTTAICFSLYMKIKAPLYFLFIYSLQNYLKRKILVNRIHVYIVIQNITFRPSFIYVIASNFSSNHFILVYSIFFSSVFLFISQSSQLNSLAKEKEGKIYVCVLYSLQFENVFLLLFLMNNNLEFLIFFFLKI